MKGIAKLNMADIVGILSASVCLVHCIATPLLIVLGAGFVTNPLFKYLFLIISFVSIFKATEFTENTKIAILLWISFTGFVVANLFEEEYVWLEYFTYGFSIVIIVGHLLNIKYCKKC